MREVSMKQLCQSIRRYANTIGNVSREAAIAEICDFGDSYGFLFDTGNRQDSLYWCIEKDTHKPYAYMPSMDVRKYRNRKILPIDPVW